MITEFQDGFVTKAKLNELVGGINANSEDISELVGRINANSEDISGLSSDLSNLNELVGGINALQYNPNFIGKKYEHITVVRHSERWCL